MRGLVNCRLTAMNAHDVANLHSDREIGGYVLNPRQSSVFEIAWYAHHQKQLSDEYFDSWVRRMGQLAREESFRKGPESVLACD